MQGHEDISPGDERGLLADKAATVEAESWTDLLDLEVSEVLEMNEPVCTELSTSDVTLHDERALTLLGGLVLDPAERSLVDDPCATLTPRDILGDTLAQMTERHGRVRRNGGVVDTLLGGEEVADEREQRLERRGRRRGRRGRRLGRLRWDKTDMARAVDISLAIHDADVAKS